MAELVPRGVLLFFCSFGMFYSVLGQEDIGFYTRLISIPIRKIFHSILENKNKPNTKFYPFVSVEVEQLL